MVTTTRVEYKLRHQTPTLSSARLQQGKHAVYQT